MSPMAPAAVAPAAVAPTAAVPAGVALRAADGDVTAFLQMHGLAHLAAQFDDEGYDDLAIIKDKIDEVIGDQELSAADAQALKAYAPAPAAYASAPRAQGQPGAAMTASYSTPFEADSSDEDGDAGGAKVAPSYAPAPAAHVSASPSASGLALNFQAPPAAQPLAGDFAARAVYAFAEMDTNNSGAVSYVELRNWIGKKMREDESIATTTMTDEMRQASLDAFAKHRRESDDMLGVEEVAALLTGLHQTAKAAPAQDAVVDVMKYVPKTPPQASPAQPYAQPAVMAPGYTPGGGAARPVYEPSPSPSPLGRSTLCV
jgi:hypothetical protein